MVRKALVWSFVGQFLSFLINFAGSVVIARLLTPHEMGVYAVSIAAIGILQLFTSLGVGVYAIREEKLTQQTMDAAFTMNLVLSMSLGLILFGTSFAVAHFLGEPAVASVLQLLAITPVISAFSFTPGVMLQRAMHFRGTSIIGTVAALINAGVTICAALAGAHYMSPAYGSVAHATLSTGAVLMIGHKYFALRLSTQGWQKILTFGMRIMSINGIGAASVRISDVILGNMLGLAALGLYSRATSINNLLFQNVYGTMTGVIFSKLSQTQRQGGDVSTIYLRGLRLVTGVMGPLLIGLAVLAGPIVRLLYGERWLGAATPLSLLLIGQFISLSIAMNWELFVVRDLLGTQTRLEMTRSVVAVLSQTLGSLISLVAVGATSISTSLISMAIYGRYMPGLVKTTRGRLTRIYVEAIVLTVAATLPSLLFMTASGWNTNASIPAMAATVALGILAWTATVFKIGHPIAEELRLIVEQVKLRLG